MASFAIYQDTPTGIARIGIFPYPGRAPSARMVAEAFHRRNPQAHTGGQLYLAKRSRLMGKWTDGERMPMDPPASLTPIDEAELGYHFQFGRIGGIDLAKTLNVAPEAVTALVADRKIGGWISNEMGTQVEFESFPLAIAYLRPDHTSTITSPHSYKEITAAQIVLAHELIRIRATIQGALDRGGRAPGRATFERHAELIRAFGMER